MICMVTFKIIVFWDTTYIKRFTGMQLTLVYMIHSLGFLSSTLTNIKHSITDAWCYALRKTSKWKSLTTIKLFSAYQVTLSRHGIQPFKAVIPVTPTNDQMKRENKKGHLTLCWTGAVARNIRQAGVCIHIKPYRGTSSTPQESTGTPGSVRGHVPDQL